MAKAPRPLKVYGEGSLTHQGNEIDFVGSGVSVSSLSGKAVVTISGGGSGVTDHGALTGLSDDDHSQYHNDSRALTWLGTRSTTDLAEGTNLYYTSGRFNTAFAAKSTTDLSEGTNLYYTAARFNSAFAAKSTSDLAEGTNLYFTNARAVSALSGCNVSMFANDAGYLTNINSEELYDLSNVGSTSPSSGHFLGWTGSAWDAMTPNIACLAGVSISSPSIGQVLKYNGSVWENGTISGGGVTFGNCYEIARMNASGTDFCYNSGFVYDGVTFDVHACGINDYQYYPWIERNGCIDTYYRANGSCCEDQVFKFGFFDGETPYWGLDSSPSATSYMISQWLRFYDYTSCWGNDGAALVLSDSDNSWDMTFMCGFRIHNTSSNWSIGYCAADDANRVKINSWYLPDCGPNSTNCALLWCSTTGFLEFQPLPTGSGSPAGYQYDVQLNGGMGNFCASNEFQYDYCNHRLILNQYMGNQQLCVWNDGCCTEGWVFCARDCGGMGGGLPFTFRLDTNFGCNDYGLIVQSAYYYNNNLNLNPHNGVAHFNHTDGMCCYHASIGYGACNTFMMQKDCFGSYEIGYCGGINHRWADMWGNYIHFENFKTGFSGVACDLTYDIINYCNYGYTQLNLLGGLGHVINGSSNGLGTPPLPFIFAQEGCEKFRFHTDGFMCVCATMNILGGWCMNGTSPAADGTYSVPTSITIQNGIITAIS